MNDNMISLNSNTAAFNEGPSCCPPVHRDSDIVCLGARDNHITRKLDLVPVGPMLDDKSAVGSDGIDIGTRRPLPLRATPKPRPPKSITTLKMRFVVEPGGSPRHNELHDIPR